MGKPPQAATENSDKVWNSLEVAKLLFSTLTPLTIGLSAAYLSHETARQQIAIGELNREQDGLQSFWEKIAPIVDELSQLGSKGEELKPADQDRMDVLGQQLQQYRIAYGPFLTDEVDRAIMKLDDDASTFDGKPNDATGWRLQSDGMLVARAMRSALRGSDGSAPKRSQRVQTSVATSQTRSD